MPCHPEGAPATEESAQPREILQSPGLPQDDMNAVEFGKLFSRELLADEASFHRPDALFILPQTARCEPRLCALRALPPKQTDSRSFLFARVDSIVRAGRRVSAGEPVEVVAIELLPAGG